jgi:octaprenyl-diphosphate synthase
VNSADIGEKTGYGLKKKQYVWAENGVFMETLSDIKALVSEHLDGFDRLFLQSMKSSAPLLNTITRYLVRKKGKQMRPLFVFLSAGMHGEITDSAHRAATLIELLHTATLIHDDVVDDAWQRRGLLSLNAIWKNKISVLVGDYLLSRGLLLALEHKEYDQLHIVSDATREMSEGELLQIEKARRLDIKEEIYFEIIRKKTASLIASCCAVGAAAAGASEEVIRQMYLFGEKTGIAFQIRDDLFDYTRSNLIGKPVGIDLKEKKLTLPIIYMLQEASHSERNRVIRIIRRHHQDKKRVAELVQMVSESGGIAYAESMMLQYTREALDILNAYPTSPYAEGLKKLVRFTTERKK